MQENEAGKRDQCGETGINGGYFQNKHRQFGVNCYGVKASPLGHEKSKHVIDLQQFQEKAMKKQNRAKMKDGGFIAKGCGAVMNNRRKVTTIS